MKKVGSGEPQSMCLQPGDSILKSSAMNAGTVPESP